MEEGKWSVPVWSRRDDLHGRNIQEHGEDDLCEGRLAGGSVGRGVRLARSSDGVFRLFESVTDSLQIQTLAREAQNPCSLFDFPT